MLADIQEVFYDRERLTTIELIGRLTQDEEKAWATYNRGRPITPRQLAKLLQVYGIRPKTVRMGTSTPKGYERAQFVDAFKRYVDRPDDAEADDGY